MTRLSPGSAHTVHVRLVVKLVSMANIVVQGNVGELLSGVIS